MDDEKLFRKIRVLCDKGDRMAARGEYQKALKRYHKALSLAPEPKRARPEYAIVYTALGETYFRCGDCSSAAGYFNEAVNLPDGGANAYALLRLGQCLAETGQTGQAREYLLRAFELEGYTIFRGEDVKYLGLINDSIDN